MSVDKFKTLSNKNIDELIDLVDGKKQLETPEEQEEGKEKITTKIYEKYELIEEERRLYPDIELLIEIGTLACVLLLLYFIWPYLKAEKSFIFSKEQYEEALKLSESNITMKQKELIDIELKALADYYKYFEDTGIPYSLKSQGIEDLARGVIFLPVVAFVGGFVIPPFILLYIMWFVIKYWKMVLEATWGWFLMLYSYGTTLIEGKLGCKWYIKMVTSWKCKSPIFSEYYDKWLIEYIDIPAYHEKVAYVTKYNQTKDKYYTSNKLKYFDKYKETGEVDLNYLKQTMVDRAGEGFLKKLGSVKKILFDDPLDYIAKKSIEDKHSKEISKYSGIKKIFNIILFIGIIIGTFFFFYYFIFNDDQKQLIKTLSKQALSNTKEALSNTKEALSNT
jgi:hypothetical protein